MSNGNGPESSKNNASTDHPLAVPDQFSVIMFTQSSSFFT